MRANGATFVYTPQVLVQGRDAEFGRRHRASELVDQRGAGRRGRRSRSKPASGTMARLAGAHVTVADAALRRNAVLWLAYTESGLVSNVKAGENRGVRLAHDHVVRALSEPHPGGRHRRYGSDDRPATPA